MVITDGPATATDDVYKCGAPRSMKNVERCLRGHPMLGAVINPNKRGSVNMSRVAQLDAFFTEDYKPRTHRQRMEVSRLAAMWEQRERVERAYAGSVEHQRLDGIVQALVDRLESSRPDARTSDGESPTVVILPANSREFDKRSETGEAMLRELLPERRPDPPSLQPVPEAGQSRQASPQARASTASTGRPEPSSEPPAPVYAYAGRLITEDDITSCMADAGDAELAAYRAGRITKAAALEATRSWLRQQRELEVRR